MFKIWEKDFLSEHTMFEVEKHIDGILMKDGNNFSVNFHWQRALKGSKAISTSPVFINHYGKQNEDLQQMVHDEVNEYVSEYGHEVDSSIIHIMIEGAEINWHSDIGGGSGRRSGAVSIYLNRKWGVDFGGELLYNTNYDAKSKDDWVIERHTPAYNSAVFFDVATHHKVMPVYENILRKSIQIWLKRKD